MSINKNLGCMSITFYISTHLKSIINKTTIYNFYKTRWLYILFLVESFGKES